MRRAPIVLDAPDLAMRVTALERALRDQRDELRDLHRLIATVLPRQPRDDAAFLAAIAEAVQDRVFSSRELVNHATVDATLRAAVVGATVKQIGKRLHRLAGQSIGAYRLTRVDRDQDGTLWTLQVG